MDFQHDKTTPATPAQPGTGETNAVDQAAMYRRVMLTKIRLRQAIFRARHLAPATAAAHRTAV